jgi:alanyl-tRNA synthetase
MTIQLYNSDHYLKEFDAEVTRINGVYVELDQTAFYAESGGQIGDTGTLNDETVAYTKYIDNRHVHIMENEPSFKEGDVIHGVINWDRRYRTMRLHSASHMMEYFLWKHFGYMKRTGSYVDENKDRADYEHEGRLDPDTLRRVEADTNKFLIEDHQITITVDLKGIRTWKCGPVEMHCAGTHVKNIQEIGIITLKRKNPGRGEERVETSLKE